MTLLFIFSLLASKIIVEMKIIASIFQELVCGKRKEFLEKQFRQELDQVGDSPDSGVQCDQSLEEDIIDNGIDSIERFLTDFESNASATVAPVVRPIATFDKEFNNLEMSRVLEVFSAGNKSVDILNYSMTKKFIEYTDLDDLLRSKHNHEIFDMNARATMKYCKALTLFGELTPSDQTTLFKSNCWKITLLRNLLAFDHDKREWTISLVGLSISSNIIFDASMQDTLKGTPPVRFQEVVCSTFGLWDSKIS